MYKTNIKSIKSIDDSLNFVDPRLYQKRTIDKKEIIPIPQRKTIDLPLWIPFIVEFMFIDGSTANMRPIINIDMVFGNLLIETQSRIMKKQC